MYIINQAQSNIMDSLDLDRQEISAMINKEIIDILREMIVVCENNSLPSINVLSLTDKLRENTKEIDILIQGLTAVMKT